MGFIQECFIRKNTPMLLDNLQRLGYDICCCCNFHNAVWLETFIMNQNVHGIGFFDEEFEPKGFTVDDVLKRFLYENENIETDKSIDCQENEELFLAIASLRDDTDKNQWFIDDDGNAQLSSVDVFLNDILIKNNWHKASVEELIKMFTT